MKILFLAAMAALCLPGLARTQTYVAVTPAYTYTYRPALWPFAGQVAVSPVAVTPAYTYTYRPALWPFAAQVALPPVAAAPDDTAAAMARLQTEVRMLTLEANVRALQARQMVPLQPLPQPMPPPK